MVKARVHGDCAGTAGAWVRRLAGWLVAALCGIALLVWYVTHDFPAPKDGAEKQAERRARARLSACLIGLPPGHNADAHLRATAIAAHDDATWPKRCVPYARELEQATRRYAAHLSSELQRDDRASLPSHDVATAISAASTGIDFERVTRDVPRPPPAPLLPEPGLLHGEWVDETTGDPDLQLRFEDVACQLAAVDGGLEPVARCSFVVDRLARSLRSLALVPATGGAPPLVLVRGDEIAGWRDGTPLITADVLRSWRDGTRVLAVTAGPRPTLWLHDGTAARAIAIDRPRTLTDASVAGGHLVWRERGGLFARALGDTLGPVVEVAKDAHDPTNRSCATAGVTALVVRTADGSHLALRIGERWAVVGPIAQRHALHCTSHSAVLTHVEDGVVERTDCTLAGCTSAKIALPAAKRSALAIAVPLGDETAVVWVYDAVWMVRGRLADLPAAKRMPLFNGYGGSAPYTANSELVQRLQGHARGESLVVILGSIEPRAIHVRGDRVEPVRVVLD